MKHFGETKTSYFWELGSEVLSNFNILFTVFQYINIKYDILGIVQTRIEKYMATKQLWLGFCYEMGPKQLLLHLLRKKIGALSVQKKTCFCHCKFIFAIKVFSLLSFSYVYIQASPCLVRQNVREEKFALSEKLHFM